MLFTFQIIVQILLLGNIVLPLLTHQTEFLEGIEQFQQLLNGQTCIRKNVRAVANCRDTPYKRRENIAYGARER